MRNVLIITSGIYYDPNYIQVIEKYKCMSKYYSGIVFFTVDNRNKIYNKHFNFEFHGLYLVKFLKNNSFFRNIFYLGFVFVKSMYFHFFKKKFDIILVQDAFKIGVLALILKHLLGVKLIIEIIGNLNKSFELDSGNFKLNKKIKHLISKYITPCVLNNADGIKLLYKEQISAYSNDNIKSKIFIFHEFVPISLFNKDIGDLKYILFVGGPWFLKGVDILISAFKIFTKKHPEYSLKIFGFSDERKFFEEQISGFDNIELHGPILYEQVISMMSNCSIFILPSRTEAMGCVMIEAMASKKPVIASNVDGIPNYLKDGYNGLLFKSEDAIDLADKMIYLADNNNYANKLAENSYKYVHKSISEENYMINFNVMVEFVFK
jgi:glycosyltransferase involved in cell wall biosynthesis